MQPAKIIYYVDDDTAILEIFTSFLKEVDPELALQTFPRADHALEAVRRCPPDVIISDHQMPEMNGTQLLEQIRQMSPATIRILLSGYIQGLDNIGAAQQCLAKPVSYFELVKTIRQALTARDALNLDICKAIGSMRSFPVLPGLYNQMVKHLDSDDWTVESLATLLAKDGGCTTRVIQLANTPLFRGEEVITSAADAVVRLGTENLRPIVLSLEVLKVFGKVRTSKLLQTIWGHSTEVAAWAGRICALTSSEDSYQAFFSGMVHDLGKLMFLEHDPKAYPRMSEDQAVPLHQAERQCYGITHAEAAAFLLRLWNVDDAIADAVSWHHSTPAEEPRVLKSNVAISLQIANSINSLRPGDSVIDPTLLAGLGVTREQVIAAITRA
jgi:HD-like signal output (HDOD) protein/CheY-like chemotaxis protein